MQVKEKEDTNTYDMEKDDTGKRTKVKTKTEKLKREAKGLNRQHELRVNKRTRQEEKIPNLGKEQDKK